MELQSIVFMSGSPICLFLAPARGRTHTWRVPGQRDTQSDRWFHTTQLTAGGGNTPRHSAMCQQRQGGG